MLTLSTASEFPTP